MRRRKYTPEQLIERFSLFDDDHKELLSWLNEHFETFHYASAESYYLEELYIHMDGLHDLAKNMKKALKKLLDERSLSCQ